MASPTRTGRRKRRPQGEILRRLARVLRMSREASNLRQSDCALAAGMSTDAWAKAENCRQKDMGLLLFSRIARGIGMRPSTLLALLEEPGFGVPESTSPPLR